VGWGAWGGGSERHISSSTTLAAGSQAAGIRALLRVDHANCLKSWIAIVKAGNLAIFTDFNLDQEQADFLKGWQPP